VGLCILLEDILFAGRIDPSYPEEALLLQKVNKFPAAEALSAMIKKKKRVFSVSDNRSPGPNDE
jgi:hypothetical protein